MPQQGENAPEFSAKDSDGRDFRLTDFRGKQRVVLYFFPACFTPGCDIEAGKFRDEFPRFQGKDVQVIGVSNDAPDVAKRFREHFRLPFPVLPDPEGKVIGLYGVAGMGGRARRVSFLIGTDGKIEEVVDSRLPGPHIEKHLRLVGG
ncbi:MAG: peroxiredoxin [Euryarchaeota archaeon]|nr:peroxiredoxin [Euryarchaeota archaeon]MDE1879089.1 peroxiredoxin [Euryarchaeota archaeon]MDE2044313.1 peroxiredoxin [Thermoplasmata archaeon]